MLKTERSQLLNVPLLASFASFDSRCFRLHLSLKDIIVSYGFIEADYSAILNKRPL